MYEAFYGFKEKPFTLTPDPKYLYPSRAHREALDHLLYGIREREGFIVITGDVGTGKTTLCRAILSQLEEGTTTAVILNPVLSEDELLRAILHDFGLTGAGRTKNELIAELNEFLLRTITAGRRAVLIVDEAQNLSRGLLEQIRLLSNLETERDKLIQIALVGQLGLLKHLASPELKQLNQRVSVRYRLEPLSYQETCQYVYHRLMVAGGTTGLTIAPGALRAIYQHSRGIPRLINLAADRTLLRGFTEQSRQITRRTATAGIKSLGEGAMRPAQPRSFVRYALLAMGINLLLAAAVTTVLLTDIRRWLPAGASAVKASASTTPNAPAAVPLTVLVGTFATEPEARAVERNLTGRGYTAMVARGAGPQGRASYSVLVGQFQKMAEAEAARNGLVANHGFGTARIVRTVDASAGAEIGTSSSTSQPGSTP